MGLQELKKVGESGKPGLEKRIRERMAELRELHKRRPEW